MQYTTAGLHQIAPLTGQGCPQQEGGILGVLHIEGEYKSAWIIGGKHRLFAYSGHHFARTARLSVLAFEELHPDIQAKLFVDINYQQKSVKKSLLNELYGVLHENSDNPEIKMRAIIMQTISLLNDDPASPFYERIQATDDKKIEIRCISIAALFNALIRYNFYIKSKKKDIFVYGPLWSGEGNEATRTRSVHIINSWFTILRQSVMPSTGRFRRISVRQGAPFFVVIRGVYSQGCC